MNPFYYFRNPRFFFPRIKYFIWEKMNPDKPWLCKEAVEFCDKNLKKDMKGIEFGSGRSTIWFAKKLSCLVSVEHDSQWHSLISQKINFSKISNIDYRLIPLNHPESEGEKSQYPNDPDYVSILKDFADEYFDFIVIDGHYRTNAIRLSMSKIKNEGLFLVDDVNFWGDFKDVPVPKTWRIVSQSTNGIKKTGIWKVTK